MCAVAGQRQRSCHGFCHNLAARWEPMWLLSNGTMPPPPQYRMQRGLPPAHLPSQAARWKTTAAPKTKTVAGTRKQQQQLHQPGATWHIATLCALLFPLGFNL